jgi:protein-S-isoprenylcysteine O-methyltransferase Ste14
MRLLLLAMWMGWLVYWTIAARGAKATRWREPVSGQWLHNLLFLLGTVVMAVPRVTPAILAQPFLPPGPAGELLGILLTALGLGIAIAARIYLGGNWSARVEIKEGHALIRTGPYRYVRHPIYSGILLALLGSALALDRWRALLGFALMVLGLWLKARHEENRLRDVLPDYSAYARETAALIPFLL